MDKKELGLYAFCQIVARATIYKECSVCKDEVVISYDCPSCKSRVCMICALENIGHA